jgi:hypothetical protein
MVVQIGLNELGTVSCPAKSVATPKLISAGVCQKARSYGSRKYHHRLSFIHTTVYTTLHRDHSRRLPEAATLLSNTLHLFNKPAAGGALHEVLENPLASNRLLRLKSSRSRA